MGLSALADAMAHSYSALNAPLTTRSARALFTKLFPGFHFSAHESQCHLIMIRFIRVAIVPNSTAVPSVLLQIQLYGVVRFACGVMHIRGVLHNVNTPNCRCARNNWIYFVYPINRMCAYIALNFPSIECPLLSVNRYTHPKHTSNLTLSQWPGGDAMTHFIAE